MAQQKLQKIANYARYVLHDSILKWDTLYRGGEGGLRSTFTYYFLSRRMRPIRIFFRDVKILFIVNYRISESRKYIQLHCTFEL